MTLPSLAELPAKARDLLPTWDQPGAMSEVWDFDGYFVSANAAYFRVLGWSEADLLCGSYWEFVHPDDQDPMVDSIDRLVRAGGVRTGYEVRLLCRNGRYDWTRWDTAADPDTKLLYGVGADITAQKPHIEEAAVQVATWVRDIDSRTLRFSDELWVMLGLPVGTPLTDDVIRDRIHPQDLPLVDGAWRASEAEKDAHSASFRVIHSDGTVRHLHAFGRVTARSDMRPVTVLGVTIDVTDRPT
jgi:PAS domain S-box-containing protein